MERTMLPPAHPHAELQALEVIQAAHAFAIHQPPLPAQEHPDPQIAKTRSRVRELTNPELQGRLVPGATGPIPR